MELQSTLSAVIIGDSTRTVTYQWQASASSCEDGFTNILGATSETYTPTNIASNTRFRVLATIYSKEELALCTLPSTCISFGSIQGCVQRDTDGNGQPNSDAFFSGLTVRLFSENDPSVPFNQTITDNNGQYTFLNIPEGNYYISFVTPNNLLFPIEPIERGGIVFTGSTSNTFSIQGGQEIQNLCTHLGGCVGLDVRISSAAIARGESVTASVGNLGGNFQWSDANGIICASCPSVSITPTQSTSISASRPNIFYGCTNNGGAGVEILEPYSATSRSCDCYGDFIFQEAVTVYSFSDEETWVVTDNDGLYFDGLPLVKVPVGTVIPYSGLDENGMHTYTLEGMHKNEKGYNVGFGQQIGENIASQVSSSNFCMLDEVCPQEEEEEVIGTPEFDEEATPGFPIGGFPVESDCVNPSFTAIHGLTIELMQSGMVEIWSTDFIHKNLMPCVDEGRLTVKGWHAGMSSKAPDNIDDLYGMPDNILFTCDHVGNQEVLLYMMDDLGNWNFVTTYVIIQDNMGACSVPEESIAMVSGTISDWKGNPVQRVGINSRQQAEIEVGRMTTTEDGIYSFNLQMDQDYLITPTKNINPLNGVSTGSLLILINRVLLPLLI